MSCNLSLLFLPLNLKNDFYIDGGIIDNYPLSHFSYNDPNVIGLGHYQLKNMI